MKKKIVLGCLLAVLAIPSSFAQRSAQSSSTSGGTQKAYTAKELGITHWWLVGGMGAGAVISTDIINSGGVLPFYLELMAQKGRTRMGLGMSHEVYLTVKNLAKVMTSLGDESYNVEKFYFTIEKMLIPNFPVNVGVCAQLGGFLTQSELKENDEAKVQAGTATNISNKNEAHPFGNVGLVAELGIKPFFLFVKPALEYKSYSIGHKELIGYVNFGIRLKFDANK